MIASEDFTMEFDGGANGHSQQGTRAGPFMSSNAIGWVFSLIFLANNFSVVTEKPLAKLCKCK